MTSSLEVQRRLEETDKDLKYQILTTFISQRGMDLSLSDNSVAFLD